VSTPATESDSGILDAGSASVEDVAAALGVGSGGQDEPDEAPEEQEQDEQGETEGVTLESLAAIVEQQRVQIATLKREKAAERVAAGKARVEPAASDQDTAVTAAVEAAKAEAKLEYGVKLAGSEIKAALAAVMTDAQLVAFVDDLNLAKYVTEDGEPDTDAIAGLKSRQLALLGRRPAAKVGHGRTGATAGKSNADQFADAFSAALNS
jgi:hypothetical protein